MGDDLERRVMALESGLSTVRENAAAFKETIHWVRTAQADLKNTIDHYHETSTISRDQTNQKLDALTRAVEARENQAKGAITIGAIIWSGVKQVSASAVALVGLLMAGKFSGLFRLFY